MERLPGEEEWRSHQEMRGQALTAVLHWGTLEHLRTAKSPQTRPSSTTAHPEHLLHPALPSWLIQHPSPS